MSRIKQMVVVTDAAGIHGEFPQFKSNLSRAEDGEDGSSIFQVTAHGKEYTTYSEKLPCCCYFLMILFIKQIFKEIKMP